MKGPGQTRPMGMMGPMGPRGPIRRIGAAFTMPNSRSRLGGFCFQGILRQLHQLAEGRFDRPFAEGLPLDLPVAPGPAGDLASATVLAAQMVGTYGMAGSLISLDASRAQADLVSKVLSDEACRQAVEGLLEAARCAARDVLVAHTQVVESLRDALLERDELIGDEITEVIGSSGEADSVIDVRSAVPRVTASGGTHSPVVPTPLDAQDAG